MLLIFDKQNNPAQTSENFIYFWIGGADATTTCNFTK